MKVTRELLIEAAKNESQKANVVANMNSVVSALDKYGARVGLDQPHRLVHFLSQLAHESGAFNYDRERANKGHLPGEAYEGRKDLGNVRPGDGVKFPGRGPMQLTGRDNVTRFTRWARTIDPSAPDFTVNPEKINTDPWEGLSAIWFWTIGNRTGKSLNVYADANNAEMITRIINGGLNGYGDRLDYYDQFGFVMLGYGPEAYREFQVDAKRDGVYKGIVDGLAGPQTRAAIHARLVSMTAKRERAPDVKKAPVVEEKPVAVPVQELEKPWWQSPEVAGPAVGGIPGLITAAGGFDWRFLVAALVVGALMTVFLIVRRDRMSKRQDATVKAIEDQTLAPGGV